MDTQKIVKLLIGLLVVIVALVLVIWGLSAMNGGDEEQELSNEGFGIASFEECVAAGYPVMESFPRQCRTPDGTVFTEDGSVRPGTGGDSGDSGGGAFQTPAGPVTLSYQGGILRLDASLQRNDACVNWKVEQSGQGNIRLNIVQERTGEVCAQVISTQQVNTVVQAGSAATVTLAFETDIILFQGTVSELSGSSGTNSSQPGQGDPYGY